MNSTRQYRYILLPALVVLLFLTACTEHGTENRPVVLSDDGGWCWFEDPRAIIHGNKLIVGTVANGRYDSLRAGDIEALVYNLQNNQVIRIELYDQLQPDDHDSPVFLVRPDDRYLTLFAKHGNENNFYYRISWPGDPARWGEINEYTPTESTRLTYSNIYMLSAENNRVYDFFRGLDNSYKPSYVYSDDLGESWETGNVYIQVPAEMRHRPYVRYASNSVDEIHMVYTEGHPRVYDNSIYHIFYRDGMLHSSDGSPITSLEDGLTRPQEGTLVYQGDSNRVAWTVDIELDDQDHPYIAYSVQVGSAGLPPGEGGEDIRYRYARWDGIRWNDYPMAYAGTKLYAGEDDYSGLVALDPDNPDVVYISTDADPESGEPLSSEADGERHYEIFKGVTADGGGSWNWTPITENSTEDNLRPIVPEWNADETMLLWLKGEYRTYTDYSLSVMALRIESTN